MIDGRPRTMRLTLGALAALEARLQAGSLMGLAERFEDGRVATADLIALLAAGLAGAGEPVDEAALAAAEIEGGAVGAMRAGMALLSRAFRRRWRLSAVDWPGLMRLGLGALRLPPEAFWSMTPGEFRLALEGCRRRCRSAAARGRWAGRGWRS